MPLRTKRAVYIESSVDPRSAANIEIAIEMARQILQPIVALAQFPARLSCRTDRFKIPSRLTGRNRPEADWVVIGRSNVHGDARSKLTPSGWRCNVSHFCFPRGVADGAG